MKPEPLLKEYRVCLVVPQVGLNAAQLVEVKARVRQVVALLPEGERLFLLVPSYDEGRPQAGVQPDVLDLEYLRARITLEGFDPRRGQCARRVCEAAEFAHRCDEVWCCPESANRLARANQVYRLGLKGRDGHKYKLIPPWVEPAGVPRPIVKQMKKERPW